MKRKTSAGLHPDGKTRACSQTVQRSLRPCSPWALALVGACHSAGAAAQSPSPFSPAFFPMEGQTEIHARLAYNDTDYGLRSALLNHHGQTRVSTLTPGFRRGIAPHWAVELQQPVAHRWEVDALNPNVGPQGLRAPTLALARQAVPSGGPWIWRQSALLQINPWSSSGLNQWGLQALALANLNDGHTLGLSAAGWRNPSTGLVTHTLTTSWTRQLGDRLVQASAGASHYGPTRNATGQAHASEAVFAGVEYSWRWSGAVWVGVELGWAQHRGRLTRSPTATLPISLALDATTTMHTLTLSVRGLR